MWDLTWEHAFPDPETCQRAQTVEGYEFFARHFPPEISGQWFAQFVGRMRAYPYVVENGAGRPGATMGVRAFAEHIHKKHPQLNETVEGIIEQIVIKPVMEAKDLEDSLYMGYAVNNIADGNVCVAWKLPTSEDWYPGTKI